MRLPSAIRTFLLFATGIILATTTATANAAPITRHTPSASAKTPARDTWADPFTGGGAPAASASRHSMPVPAGCSWGQLCAYHEAGFGGNTHAVIDPVPSGSCDGYSRADWRSAINITNQYARFWDHNDCTGANKLLPPGYSTADFGFDANGVGGL
jgi:hypothetical protein